MKIYKMIYQITSPRNTKIKEVKIKCDPEETCDSKCLAYAMKESRKIVNESKGKTESIELKGYSITEE